LARSGARHLPPPSRAAWQHLMPHRFYLPQLAAAPPHRLEAAEAHHLAHVLRLDVGDTIEVFDGQGRAAPAVVEACSKREVCLRLGAVRCDPPPPFPLVVATAIPKGARCDWLVEKLAELGAARWVPLNTTRGVVQPREHKLDRLRQLVVSACKQSGRNWLMDIAPLTDWDQFLHREVASVGGFLVDPSGQPWTEVIQPPPQSDAATLFAIGPEGGWTREEIKAAVGRGMHTVTLGARILRVETAALAVAATWSTTVAAVSRPPSA